MRAQSFKSLPGLLLCAGVLLLALSPAYTQTETSDTAEEIVVYGEREGGGGVDVIQIPIWMFQQIGNFFPELPELPKIPGPGGGGDDTPEPDPCAELAAEIANIEEQLENFENILNDFDDIPGVIMLGRGEDGQGTAQWFPNGSKGFNDTKARHKGQTILLQSKLARKQRTYEKECGS